MRRIPLRFFSMMIAFSVAFIALNMDVFATESVDNQQSIEVQADTELIDEESEEHDDVADVDDSNESILVETENDIAEESKVDTESGEEEELLTNVSKDDMEANGFAYRVVTKDGDTYAVITGLYYEDYEAEKELKENTTSVIIPGSIGGYAVKEIDSYAFSGYKKLASVYFPSGLKTIGAWAFHECIELKMSETALPEGLTKVGTGAFSKCEGLTSITIPSTVKDSGSDVFHDCTNLKTISFASGIKIIPSNMCNNANYVETVNLPSGLETIGDYAFYNCNRLVNIEYPSSLKEIESWAFSGCTELKMSETALPEGLTKVGTGAFSKCEGLTSITIPSTVKDSGNDVFHDCTNLKTINFASGIKTIPSNMCNNANYVETVNLPSGLETIGDYAFYNCNRLVNIEYPKSLKEIGNWAFYNCTVLKMNETALPEGLTKVGVFAFSKCEGLTSITIPSTVKDSGNDVFHDCTNLKTISFASGIKTIPRNMCNNANYVETVNLPSGLETIGDYAFYNCNRLVNIEYPKSLKEIGNWAFTNCTVLKMNETALPEGLTKVGVFAFSKCEGLTSITIPSTVKYSGNDVFHDCTNLKTINFASGIKTIPSNMCNNANYVETINLPSGVEIIESYAFYNCSRLVKIEYPKSLKEIGNWAFTNCTELILSETAIPEGLEIIGAGAFQKCNGLTSLTIPSTLKKSGGSVFLLCKNLKKLSFASGMKKVPDYMCSGCEFIEQIVLPEGLNEIGSYAFDGCTALKTINFPIKLTKISSRAFNDCTNLTFAENALPIGLKEIGGSVFDDCDNLTSIVIPHTVTSVGKSNFVSCDKLTKITYNGTNCTIYLPYVTDKVWTRRWGLKVVQVNEFNNGVVYLSNASEVDDLAEDDILHCLFSLLPMGYQMADVNLSGPQISILGHDVTLFSQKMTMSFPLQDLCKANYYYKKNNDGTYEITIGVAKESDANSVKNFLKNKTPNAYGKVQNLLSKTSGEFGLDFEVAGYLYYKPYFLSDGTMVMGEGSSFTMYLGVYPKLEWSSPFPVPLEFLFWEIGIEGNGEGNLNFLFEDKTQVFSGVGASIHLWPNIHGALGLGANSVLDIKGGLRGTLDILWTIPDDLVAQLQGSFFYQYETPIPGFREGGMEYQIGSYTLYDSKAGDEHALMNDILGEEYDTLCYSNEPYEIEEFEEALLQSDAISDGKDSIVYQEAKPQILDTEDGRIVVYLDDTIDTENRQIKLVYQIEKNGELSEQKQVYPEGYLNTAAKLKEVNGVPYIVFLSSNQKIEEGTDSETAAKALDMYVSRFDGTAFEEPVLVERASGFPYTYDIVECNSMPCVVWAENSANDILGLTGGTSLYKATIGTDGVGDKVLLASENYPILDLDFDVQNNDVVYAYMVNDKVCDYNGNIIDMSEHDDFVRRPTFYNGDLYILGGVQLLKLIDGEFVATGAIVTSDYYIDGSYIYWTQGDGLVNNLYRSKLDGTELIQITDEGGYVGNFAVESSDSTPRLYYVYQNTDVDNLSDPYGPAVLKSTSDYTRYQAGILNISYDAVDFDTSTENNVYLTVRNSGTKAINNIKIDVYRGEECIQSGIDVAETIAVGETFNAIAKLVVPGDYSGEKLRFVLYADEQFKYPCEYEFGFEISDKDVEISCTDNETIKITNHSSSDAENVALKLYDRRENPEMLIDAVEIGTISPNQTVEYKLTDEIWNKATVNELMGEKYLYCSVSQSGNEFNLVDNDILLSKKAEVVCEHDFIESVEYPTETSEGCTVYTCTLCGYTFSRRAGYERAEINSVSLDLSTGGSVGLNIYTKIPEEVVESGSIILENISKDEIVHTVPMPVKQKDGTYKVTISMNAKEMNDQVRLFILDKDGVRVEFVNERATDGVFYYSIKEYIDYVQKNSSDEDLKSLLSAMYDYGLIAQSYFNYRTPGKEPQVEVPDYSSISDPMINVPEGIKYVGSSLVLDDKIRIRHYFKLDGSIDEYTFSESNNVLIPVVDGNMCYVETSPISTRYLADVSEVKIQSDSDTEGKYSIKYNPMIYCKKANATSNEKLKNLVNSIYQYYTKTVTYFAVKEN